MPTAALWRSHVMLYTPTMERPLEDHSKHTVQWTEAHDWSAIVMGCDGFVAFKNIVVRWWLVSQLTLSAPISSFGASRVKCWCHTIWKEQPSKWVAFCQYWWHIISIHCFGTSPSCIPCPLYRRSKGRLTEFDSHYALMVIAQHPWSPVNFSTLYSSLTTAMPYAVPWLLFES